MTKEANKTRSFGEVIRERRRQLELTQEEVALQIETSIPFIGHLEANKRRPSDATVTKLADALGLDRGELFFLANPEARALLQQEKPGANSAWGGCRKDESRQRAPGIRREELEMLAQVALRGHVRSVRDFVYILQT